MPVAFFFLPFHQCEGHSRTESSMDNDTTSPLMDDGTNWTYQLLSHWPNILHGLLVVGVISQLWKAFYRLYLHPLAHIPGPRLASVSSLYGFYYNYIHDGTYSKIFPGLHKKYGISTPVNLFSIPELRHTI